MAEDRKFNFVSPGVFIREIDNSQVPSAPLEIGPVIIGRMRRGPGMRPVKVGGLSEFIEIFGNPVRGGQADDIWRNGNTLGPTYAAYAAYAWLSNNSAATIVRLLGSQHDSAVTDSGEAGWKTESIVPQAGGANASSQSTSTNGGAFGIFIVDSGSTGKDGLIPNSAPGRGAGDGDRVSTGAGVLAAVLYAKKGTYFTLSGTSPNTTHGANNAAAQYIENHLSTDKQFKLNIRNDGGASGNSAMNEDYIISFGGPTNSRYIRKVLNTNPTKTNTAIVSAGSANATASYWLGETFDGMVNRYITGSSQYAWIGALHNTASTENHADHRVGSTEARTGWVIPQDRGDNTGSFDIQKLQKLFRFIARDSGEWAQKNLKVSITNIKKSTNLSNKYGTFTVLVRKACDTDTKVNIVERFSGCNLNPNSKNFIGRKIGTMYETWDDDQRLYRLYGQHPNISKYVYVDMHADIKDTGPPAEDLPFGFIGAPRYRRFAVSGGIGHREFFSVDRAGVTGISSGDSTFKPIIAAPGNLPHPGLSLYNGPGPVRATLVDAIDVAGVAEGDAFTMTVPVAAGGEAGPVAHQFLFSTTSAVEDNEVVTTFGISTEAAVSDVATATAVIDAINGSSSPHVKYGAANLGSVLTANTLGLTAFTGSTTTKVSLTMINAGTAGNVANVLAANEGFEEGSLLLITAFTGGLDTSRVVDAKVTGMSSPWVDTYLFPAPLLRVSASEAGTPRHKDAYFGVSTDIPGKVGKFDESYWDMTRLLSTHYVSSGDVSVSSNTDTLEDSYYFSLDDLKLVPGMPIASSAVWASGSRKNGGSARGTSDYGTTLLDNEWNKFTMDLHGGFDGFDITEKEPLRNSILDASISTPKERNSYEYNTVKRAIDTVADAEVVEMNLLTIPGLWQEDLTDHAIAICESRGDALAIVDLKGDYTADTEGTTSEENRVGNVDETISNLLARSVNSSYGCAYYPWLQVQDPLTRLGVYVPPSVIALGVMASSEKKSELWFAPAGFNRGGLTRGAAGLQVINTTQRLTAAERDKLYLANINPIATFPAEGHVIFGQKTLQITPSALDRINVRRLLIFIKKRISRQANIILFDQNTKATWNRFLGQANPFLATIKTKFGLTDYKVVLDETDPTLQDRNILYAKIYLKPARAIEYIAIDFNISRTGASFVD